MSISFGRSFSLQSSIISAYYCTDHYTTISESLWVFISNRTISKLAFLSYVFNFSCHQISAYLKSVCWLHPLVFHYKTNPSPKWKYPKDTPNNYFHGNDHNLTHSLLLSIVELKKNKTRCFQKLHSEFFCNIVRLNDIKKDESLRCLYAQCFMSLLTCPLTLPMSTMHASFN